MLLMRTLRILIPAMGLLAGSWFAHQWAIAASAAASGASGAGKSQWVYYDSKGKLAYRTTERGDRIMDFSFAGYMGGGVKIPTVPVKETVGPTGRDDTAAIQAAIDAVSKLPATDGFRGAVLLKPGNYSCSAPLQIKTSGVVLRGSGSKGGGTTIVLTGKEHPCISISGPTPRPPKEKGVEITDAYVPSGATSFHVTSTAGMKVGQEIIVQRPVTPAWIDLMDMDTLKRNGKGETWLSPNTVLHSQRTIKAIAGDLITIDIPLTDSLDAKYLKPPGASVIKAPLGERVSQIGVESLRIVSPPQKVSIDQPHYNALKMSGAADCWARDLEIVDTVDSVSIDATRATIENVNIVHTVATVGAAKPADFSCGGSQVLFNRCSGNGDNIFYFVTDARVTGPIVLLNCLFHGNGHIQPHQRWATGLLVDNCQVPESGIDFMNRGIMGSGHGWTIGWAVAWNCVAKSYVIQQPPGATNWSIGSRGAHATEAEPGEKGPKLPEGTFDSPGAPVNPSSLYLAQLKERLGAEAVKNIGY